MGGVSQQRSPSVPQVEGVVPEQPFQPMPDLMGAGPTQIIRCTDVQGIPNILVIHDHPIGRRIPSRELSISQKATTQVADPKVKVIGSRPGIFSSLGIILHIVTRTEIPMIRGCSCNPRSGIAVRIPFGQTELDLGIGSHRIELRSGVRRVGIHPTEILVEDIELRKDLSIVDVL